MSKMRNEGLGVGRRSRVWEERLVEEISAPRIFGRFGYDWPMNACSISTRTSSSLAQGT